MKDSSTYQKILAEGRAEGISEGEEQGRLREAQNMLPLFGKGRLGEANAEVTRKIRAFTSVERLESLAERLVTIESWDELLV